VGTPGSLEGLEIQDEQQHVAQDAPRPVGLVPELVPVVVAVLVYSVKAFAKVVPVVIGIQVVMTL
jgi:hypothetical protein